MNSIGCLNWSPIWAVKTFLGLLELHCNSGAPIVGDFDLVKRLFEEATSL